MPIVSPLINALIFWGNFLQELSSRVEEAQQVTVFKNWPHLERLRIRFWAWMEGYFVRFWFDGEDHTENALKDSPRRTYNLEWYNLWKRTPGPLFQGWLVYEAVTHWVL